MFDIPALFNKGGPTIRVGETTVSSTTTVMMLIKNYVVTGVNQNMGRAASYSIVLFFVTMAVSLVFYRLTAEKSKDGR